MPAAAHPQLSDEFALSDRALGDHRHLVEISGVIDLFTGPEVKARVLALADAGTSELVLDLSAATYLDSTGLGVLLAASKRLEREDGRMVVISRHPAIARVLAITGLDTLFTIVGTREQALAELDAAQRRETSPLRASPSPSRRARRPAPPDAAR